MTSTLNGTIQLVKGQDNTNYEGEQIYTLSDTSMKLDNIKKLQHKKYRQEFGCYLIEGEHLLLELEKAALSNPALKQSELLLTDQHQDWPTGFKKTLISTKQMAAISATKSPQGMVAVVPILDENVRTARQQTERAIYLYQVQDPGNLGTILRSLAWFGNFRCLLSPNSVDPYNPKVVRASMGAIFHVPLELEVPIESLSTRFQAVACLDLHGQALSNNEFKDFDCYLFGSEAGGLPQRELKALNPQAFSIAGCGAIESLNLAATVNMCVYELGRVRG